MRAWDWLFEGWWFEPQLREVFTPNLVYIVIIVFLSASFKLAMLVSFMDLNFYRFPLRQNPE